MTPRREGPPAMCIRAAQKLVFALLLSASSMAMATLQQHDVLPGMNVVQRIRVAITDDLLRHEELGVLLQSPADSIRDRFRSGNKQYPYSRHSGRPSQINKRYRQCPRAPGSRLESWS